MLERLSANANVRTQAQIRSGLPCWGHPKAKVWPRADILQVSVQRRSETALRAGSERWATESWCYSWSASQYNKGQTASFSGLRWELQDWSSASCSAFIYKLQLQLTQPSQPSGLFQILFIFFKFRSKLEKQTSLWYEGSSEFASVGGLHKFVGSLTLCRHWVKVSGLLISL